MTILLSAVYSTAVMCLAHQLRMVATFWDEDALRREFGSDTELDELETAGGYAH